MLKITKIIFVTALLLVVSGCEDEKEQNAKMHFNQGFSYIGSLEATLDQKARKKLLDSAAKEFTQALVEKPNYFDALLNRGVIYVAQGKLNKAENDYRLAQSINPIDPTLNYNMACLYSLTSRIDLSLDALDKALKNGFSEIDRLRHDSDLENVRKTKEFFTTLEAHKFFIR